MARLNKEETLKYNKEYYLKNREKLLKYRKKYCENNEGKIKETNRKCYLKKRRERIEKQKTYSSKNRKKINNYLQKKRKEDISFRLSNILTTRIKDALRGKSKRNHTAELIGCSIEFFKKHIEKQFTEGMTWKNYGYWGWHIDHKVPCAKFNLLIEEEQKKCFHYTNLQPLWMKDNLEKGYR